MKSKYIFQIGRSSSKLSTLDAHVHMFHSLVFMLRGSKIGTQPSKFIPRPDFQQKKKKKEKSI